MENNTLYRKYRPIDFDTVVGQDNIVKTLKNQIIKGKIAHAYLFCGTRGTGKTTIAKIFARSINCPHENAGNPCNECNTCKSSLEGNNLNIYELDAASNNGVEHIRHIGELIEYPPINNEKYKVFIIDEAHALTSSAEQAFLKILEEPPEYVVYILATTEPNKISETILSRCQKFNFKRINIEDIIKYLKYVCEKENIEVEDDAISFIAEKGDGSMRESISKLDRCRAFAYNEKLTKSMTEEILGEVSDEEFSLLLKAINDSDVKEAIKIIANCIDKGKDILTFLNDFIWHIRGVLISKEIKGEIENIGITKEKFEKYKEEGKSISIENLFYYIEELSKAVSVLKFDENRRVILESCIIRLATPKTYVTKDSVLARLSDIEEKIKLKSFVKVEKENVEIENEEKKVEKKEENTKIKEVKLNKVAFEELKKVKDTWSTLISSLSGLQKATLSEATLIIDDKEEGFIKILIRGENEYKLLDIKEDEKIISEQTKKLLDMNVLFKILPITKTNFDENIKVSVEDNIREMINMKIEEVNDK